MPDASSSPAHELDLFLESHPDIEFIDFVLIDQLGTPRGKRLPRDEAKKAYESGVNLAGSVYALEANGASVEASGLVWDDGDADRVCWPVPGSLMRQSWEKKPSGLAQMAMREVDGSPFFACPRARLQDIEARLTALGLTPVVALEFEFYFLAEKRGPSGEPILATAPGKDNPPQLISVYSLDDLRAFEPVLSEIVSACAEAGVPAATATAEYAPGQFEINLNHVEGAVHAADIAIRFKQIVRGVAKAHGIDATFMPRPFETSAGSGLHCHISLLDQDGINIFADNDEHGSQALRHGIQGLAATMAEFTALFAPTANSYRRLQPGYFAPLAPCWGVNNRTLALRIPASSPQARRVEHRVAGADANPYLLLCALIAGLHKGVTEKVDPPPPTTGNAYAQHPPAIPTDWKSALALFKQSETARSYLGGRFVDLFFNCRDHERRKFDRTITPTEWKHYLML